MNIKKLKGYTGEGSYVPTGVKKKKKRSFFQKVLTGVTGKTPEQREADSVLKGRIRAKQLASFRAEQLKQATHVGEERARIQAKQQIKAMSQPKKTGLIDIGDWGKTKAGFNPLTFGTSAGAFGSGTKKGLTPMQVANMNFPDYSKPMKAKVKKKIKHRRKKKGKRKSGKQAFTITMK